MRLSAPTLANITHCGVVSAGLLVGGNPFWGASHTGIPPGQRSPPAAPNSILQHNYILSGNTKQSKTFNNGSLGSGIDEERSEMR